MKTITLRHMALALNACTEGMASNEEYLDMPLYPLEHWRGELNYEGNSFVDDFGEYLDNDLKEDWASVGDKGQLIIKKRGDYYFDAKNKLHRTGGPAVDQPTLKKYYKRGLLHRVSGPAVIRVQVAGNWKEESYYQGGVLHNTEGPAVRVTDTKQVRETWMQEGKYYRENGKPCRVWRTGEEVNLLEWADAEGRIGRQDEIDLPYHVYSTKYTTSLKYASRTRKTGQPCELTWYKEDKDVTAIYTTKGRYIRTCELSMEDLSEQDQRLLQGDFSSLFPNQ